MQHAQISPGDAISAPFQMFLVPDTRQAKEELIEALIASLDNDDGDPDLELSGDELDYSICGWSAGRWGLEDLDLEIDDPTEESEPGDECFHAAGYMIDAQPWFVPPGAVDDDEDDDAAESNVDDEGERSAWPERVDQSEHVEALDAWFPNGVHEDDEDDDPVEHDFFDMPRVPEEIGAAFVGGSFPSQGSAAA